MRRIHWYRAEKEKTNDTEVIKDQTYNNLSDLSTIQFRLIFKGHKSLNTGVYSIIHLTSAITISYAESNGGIFVLIAPFGNTNTRTNPWAWTNVLRVICQQHVLRAINCQYNFA